MINRILIRLKVAQIVYAYYQNGGKNPAAAEKELMFSISKAYDLYFMLLMLVTEVTEQASRKLIIASEKHRPTAEDLNPNRKFADNKFAAQVAANKSLHEFVSRQKKTWSDHQEFIKRLTDDILNSDIYKEYMEAEGTSYEEDREVWRKLYKQFIEENESLDDILEDISLYWNGDKEIVDSFVIKTIKRFKPENGPDQELLPMFRDEEDHEYASELLMKTLENADYYRHLIDSSLKNWELKRVTLFDRLILQIAIAEMLTFPDIPVSVTINEYVDLAKHYSTPRSGGFVNGTLDGIARRLEADKKLVKNTKK